MSNLNALNTVLRTADTADKLIAEYRKICPLVLEPSKAGETERDALNYCSGAAEFVMTLLSGGPGLYSQAVRGTGLRKSLDASTASGLLAKVKGSGGLRIGYLIHAGEGGHECVFAGSGNQWGFFQANVNGSESQRFTLVPKLNPLGRNWCLNDMNENQFSEFFVGLTDAGYGIKLFNPAMVKWHLALFSVSGQNLLG